MRERVQQSFIVSAVLAADGKGDVLAEQLFVGLQSEEELSVAQMG